MGYLLFKIYFDKFDKGVRSNERIWLIGQKVCVKTLITLDIY